MKWYSLFSLLFLSTMLQAQTISIKQFGAKGDGKTNDHDAFRRAAEFINKKRSNVTLLIPTGVYRVGKQKPGGPNGAYLLGEDVFALSNCSNIKIIGKPGSVIKYVNNLKFGAFDPNTGLAHPSKLPFYNSQYVAQIGSCFHFNGCRNIKLTSINVHGNSDNMIIGGQWGDTGYQIAHYGLFIMESRQMVIEKCTFNSMALDGMCVQSKLKDPMDIVLRNCKSEYNGRQGLSWVGGSGLTAINCSFSHTGRGKLSSSPGAGVDFECENDNKITNGLFQSCSFTNNIGCGIVADSGPSENIQFENSTFWGVTTWSAWVQKPKYIFKDCRFHGSFVHGFVTSNPSEATRFESCVFEDKLYNGKETYGKFLLESDGRKLMYFTNCTFIANKKKVMWYNGAGQSKSDMAQFLNCTIQVKTNALAQGDFYAVMRRMQIDGLKLDLHSDKNKKYYLVEDGSTITNLTRKEWSK